jgi:hypothetical protein
MSEENNVNQEQPDDGVIRVDLRNFNKEVESESNEDESQAEPAEEAQPLQQHDEVEPPEDIQEPLQDNEKPSEEAQVLEEVTDEVEEKKPDEALKLEAEKYNQVEEKEEPRVELPEGLQKLVEFMNDTGGTLEDYVRLNQDVNSLDEVQLLREYYAITKPHLDKEEIDFIVSDNFYYDEDIDDERKVKRKKLAYKEELVKARKHLNSMKDQYYKDIKAGSRLNSDQQKAVDFFDRYNKEQEQQEHTLQKQQSLFVEKTNQVFGEEFKGFEYSVGDKRYRYNVKKADEVKNTQSDINNFVRKFLNKDNTIDDAKGYHKALFTAMNADAIANHFYEQGKTDAMKDSVSKSKNIDMQLRGQHEGVTKVGGVTVRAVSGDSSSKLRVKFNK